MRVLVVTTWFPSSVSPESGIFIQRDVELLSETHEVDVLHLCAPDLQDEPRPYDLVDGVTLTRFPMSSANPLSVVRAASALRRLLPQYDLVHTMAASALLPFALLHRTTPWVHTEHWSGLLAPETLGRVARLSLPLVLRLMVRPDVVVVVGSLLAGIIRGHRTGSLRIIPNAVVAPETVKPRRAVGEVVRLVAVGGLIPRKGPTIAIQAVRSLHDAGIDAELRWIGEGPLRTELERQTAKLGLSGAVDWTGIADSSAVLAALADADVFILPTVSETFGVSIAEALASGRPVVVGANGGHTDFVHEPNGVLIAERSGAAYAGGVRRVLDLNRGRTADDIAISLGDRFTPDSRRKSYQAVYMEAMGIARARTR